VQTKNSSKTALSASAVVIDISDEIAVAGNADALVQVIADKLFGGTISPTLAAEARAAALRIAATKPAIRVADALYLVVTSPEFAVQR
jgi:hypothetical protein